MMKYELNIEFNSQEELDEWLEEHVVDNTYQGGKVFMIGSFVDLETNKVTLKSISVVK